MSGILQGLLASFASLVELNLYGWGANSSGPVGDNTTINHSSPVQIGALTDWSQISSGNENSASIKTDGTLWTWGNNNNGQIGDNTTIRRSSPVQIGALTNWAQVDVGKNSTMGAVKTDGTLWTWGGGTFISVGDGTTIRRSSPVQIGALTNWAQVSAGTYHFMVVKTNGTLWGWGNNSSRQVGTNNYTSYSSPVQIGALTNWASVAAGTTHNLARNTSNNLFTWGNNSNGQLGNGGTSIVGAPTQIGVLSNWGQIAAGSLFSGAVKTDGTLWMWGRDLVGQLGDGGTLSSRSSPVQIGALTNWKKVDLGDSTDGNTVAVKTDGTLWAWGFNGAGSLGDNTVINKNSPIQVGLETNWSDASTGNQVVIALG